MKGKRILISVLALGLILALVAGLSLAQGPRPPGEVGIQAAPVGTAASAPLSTSFTYQGRLTDGGSPANGSYDFRFTLYDAETSGSQVGGTVNKDDVTVTDGLFTVGLDFGSGVFTGDARWLEIGVRPGASTGAYTTLSPRQALTPAPYALALPGLWTQQNATSPNLIGGYSGNNVTAGVEGATIGGGGDSGSTNRVTDDYGTVNGGKGNQAGDNTGTTEDNCYATVGGGKANTASGQYAAVAGGELNTASGWHTAVSGGYGNTANAQYATIGGGKTNTATHNYATVSGGTDNTAEGSSTTVGGGKLNTASGWAATIPGGDSNTAQGGYSFAAGRRAKANHQGAFVWADSTDADFASTANDQFAVRANGGVAFSTGGASFRINGGDAWTSANDGVGSGLDADLLDGQHASAFAPATHNHDAAYVNENQADSVTSAMIQNGSILFADINQNGCTANQIMKWSGTAWACAADDTGAGGDFWSLTGNAGTSGSNFLGTTDNQALELRVNNARALRLEPNTDSPNLIGGLSVNRVTVGVVGATIGGGGAPSDAWGGPYPNSVTDDYGTVGGGKENQAGDNAGATDDRSYATVGGGIDNAASNVVATVGGGGGNTASGSAATIGGGELNIASGEDATVGGGVANIASGGGATISGGAGNVVTATLATVGGGYDNTASGDYATVPGGERNTAQGNHSFAAGYRAKANHDGAFVWADSTDADFASTAADQFAVRANGGALVTGSSGEPMLTVTNLGGDDGLRVNKSGDDGLQIGDGVNFPNYGVYIPWPGVPYNALAVQTADVNGEWALVTADRISAANVTFSSLTLVAVVDGPNPLSPGDLVAAAGLADPLPDSISPLPRVRLADGKTWTGVIGVVEGRMALQPMPGKADKDGHAPLELHSVPGSAKAGDYVALTVLGVAEVKVDATAGDVVAGQRLTAADRPGHVRALRTRALEGMVVTEGAPVVGIALAPLDKDTGLIPVLVTLR